MSKTIKDLVKELAEKDQLIKLQTEALELLIIKNIQDRGRFDAQVGNKATSDNEYYLAAYGIEYARQEMESNREVF